MGNEKDFDSRIQSKENVIMVTKTQRQNDCACSAIFVRELACSRAVCEWTLEGENEAPFSPNFKPSVDENEFYYLKRHWDFDRDASGVLFRKLQTVSGL